MMRLEPLIVLIGFFSLSICYSIIKNLGLFLMKFEIFQIFPI